MVRVFATAIGEVPDHFLSEDLLARLNTQKRERLQRFVHSEDIVRTLMGERLVRDIAKRELGVDEAAIRITTNAHGKPFLMDYPGFHFNLSHSGRWVVCAVGANPVGIDVELMSNADLEAIAVFFSEEEQHDLAAKSAADQKSHFYRLWTLKESLVKCIGSGLFTDLGSFTIKIEDDRIYMKDRSGAIDDRYRFRIFDFDRDYALAGCSEGEAFANDVMKV
jgi:4'-phosphopantetheinyl transferase